MPQAFVKPLDKDDPCYQDINCENAECQDKIVDRHDLKTADAFNAMVSAFKEPMLPSKEYSRKEIEALIDALDCTQGHHIEFDAKKQDNSTNNDIELYRVEHAIAGKYSIAFFKGVIRKYGSTDRSKDTFHFYKAKDAKGVTIAVKFHVDGKGDVYFADLVGLYP